jgi:sialate O-acetylesterase
MTLVLLAVSGIAHARVELPRLFSNGAVLQRDQPIRVWGLADAGAPVHVDFNGNAVDVVAGGDGRWSATLPAHAAGGPYQLSVHSGGTTQVVRDVLVGDVWLASGQSNMEWPVAQAGDADAVIAGADDLLIRHFKIPKSWSGKPEQDVAGGSWVAASSQTVAKFSAVAYAFARELRAATGVPIGIIDSTWGGSSIEAWMDAASQGINADEIIRQGDARQRSDAQALAGTNARLARWSQSPVDTSRWQDADFNGADWDTIPVPGLWETGGYNGMDGEAWYRASFTLSAAEAAAGVTLGVGRIDDSDITWVNGTQVGETRMQYNLPRAYVVPPESLRAGVNHVAVRVSDFGGGGGIHGDASEVFVQPQGRAKRALDGAWKFRPAMVSVALVDDKNQVPTLLYNAMIHPLQPYPLRGVIWYQGESNAAARANAVQYRQQFPSLIKQWRQQWSTPDVPFLWVQLANFTSGADTASESPWAILRESQSAALALPATAQAVAIDIGNPDDIHPLDKQTVGHRLALGARHVAYGESLVYSGPVYRSARFEGDKAYVDFDTQGSALAVHGDSGVLQGFELAGDDRRFHAAQARVQGDVVVVSSEAVSKPKAVRYAWRDNPEHANLGNRDQLPASPFRSDTW